MNDFWTLMFKQWWFSGSLIDDTLMMIKYVFIFLIIALVLTIFIGDVI